MSQLSTQVQIKFSEMSYFILNTPLKGATLFLNSHTTGGVSWKCFSG